MEVGKYLDLRHDMTQSNYYTCWIECTGSSMLNIPNLTTNSVTYSGNVTGSNITTMNTKITTLETKTTSLSYAEVATTISNTLRLPIGISIDPTNDNIWYSNNRRVEKWRTAPWGGNVHDALILLDHINTADYSNNVRMINGRIDLFRHPRAFSHGVYIDITLIHFGIETVPQIANINYTSILPDDTEPSANEPRLALVTHTASLKQYIAIHVPYYRSSGRVHFSGIISTLSDSIPMLMCLPGDGYVINESPYNVYARKQEWNHGLRCVGNIEAPNITNILNRLSGFNADGTELTVSRLNGVDTLEYAMNSSLNTLAGRVTTVETKTSGFNANGTELTLT